MLKYSELDTIWRVPDDLWYQVELVLEEHYPRKLSDQKRVNLRPVLNGIIYKLRTGCQWNALPREFGDDSTAHRHFQAWCQRGIFEKIWTQLVGGCALLEAVEFEWQSVDGCQGKARGIPKNKAPEQKVGPNPTDRGKAGVKRSVVSEGGGRPLGVVVAGANINDALLLEATLEARVVEDPAGKTKHLCLDLAYDTVRGRSAGEKAGFVLHIRRWKEEVKISVESKGDRQARRWVVERCHAWLNRCRSILIRWEHKAENYLGLVKLACALLWFRYWKFLTVD